MKMYSKVVEEVALEIRGEFVKTEAQGYLSDILEIIANKAVARHYSDILKTVEDLADAVEARYVPDKKFNLADAVEEAFIAEAELISFSELLYARYCVKSREMGREPMVDKGWFEEADGNDLLDWWDDFIVDRILFKCWVFNNSVLTSNQEDWLAEQFFKASRGEVKIEDEIEKYTPNLNDVWCAEGAINDYLQREQPEVLDLRAVYTLVVRNAMRKEADNNRKIIDRNKRIHEGEDTGNDFVE